MKQFRNNVIRAGLGALYFTGAHYLLRPIFSGVGAIFMLHHVRPRRDVEFQPRREASEAGSDIHDEPGGRKDDMDTVFELQRWLYKPARSV
jgi:hypothetical protein